MSNESYKKQNRIIGNLFSKNSLEQLLHYGHPETFCGTHKCRKMKTQWFAELT